MVWYMLHCTHLQDRYDKSDSFFSDFISLLSCFCGILTKLSKQNYLKSPDKHFFLLIIFRLGLSGVAHGLWCKNACLPKICHTYPTMIKLSTVIPYLKKIQNIYKSRDTSIKFCGHQYFFTKSETLVISRNTDIDCISIHNC